MTFVSQRVGLGTDPETGERLFNRAFSAIEPPAVKARVEAVAEDFNLSIIARAVLKVLSANKLKVWSNIALADAVAADDSVAQRSSSIRQKWLPALREEKSSSVRHCYDRMKGRWQFAEADKADSEKR